MIIIEKRIVRKDWFETYSTKTGWDSHGWSFEDDGHIMPDSWTVVYHIHLNKFGNPILGVAEKETKIT